MCLQGSKLAFKKSCRPIIGLDGCHLKSKYGGQIAVGRDPNDQYLPLAFVVVENETGFGEVVFGVASARHWRN